MKSLYSIQQKRNILIFTLVALGLLISIGLRTYLSALLGSVILYVLFRKMYNKGLRKKINRNLLVFAIILFSFVVIIIPFLFLSIMLTDKIIYYASHIQDLVDIVYTIETRFGIQLRDKEVIANITQKAGVWAGNLFPSIVAEAVDLLVGLGLMYFTLYYMFVEQDAFRKNLHFYLPFESDTLLTLGTELENNVYSNIVGQGVISMIQGAMLSLGFWIFGFEDALFWGVIGFFVSFIPVLGTPLVWAPAGIIALVSGDTFNGVGILLFGAVLIMNIDNVLRFAIAKKIGDIHPLITISGVILGVPLMGILGLVVGPLLISYFVTLVKVYRQKYGHELPETT